MSRTPAPQRQSDQLFKRYKKLNNENDEVIAQVADVLAKEMADEAKAMPREELDELATDKAADLFERWHHDEAWRAERMKAPTPFDHLLERERQLATEILETEAMLLDTRIDETKVARH